MLARRRGTASGETALLACFVWKKTVSNQWVSSRERFTCVGEEEQRSVGGVSTVRARRSRMEGGRFSQRKRYARRVCRLKGEESLKALETRFSRVVSLSLSLSRIAPPSRAKPKVTKVCTVLRATCARVSLPRQRSPNEIAVSLSLSLGYNSRTRAWSCEKRRNTHTHTHNHNGNVSRGLCVGFFEEYHPSPQNSPFSACGAARRERALGCCAPAVESSVGFGKIPLRRVFEEVTYDFLIAVARSARSH